MTRTEILGLAKGQWVQETLNTRYGPRRGAPKWGRPRRVLSVEKVFETRKGVSVCFCVSFGSGAEFLRWTAVADDGFYRLAPRPTPKQLKGYAAAAELNPRQYD